MEYVCVCVCVQCDHSVRRSGCYPSLSQHLGLKIPNGYFKISCSTSELQMKKSLQNYTVGAIRRTLFFSHITTWVSDYLSKIGRKNKI